MDDLAGKLSQMLSDPETLQQIKGLTGMLQKDAPTPAPAATPAPAQDNGLGGLGGLDLASALSGDTLQTIMRVMPLLGEFKKEDDSTRLLNALRPFLGDERRKKLDEAGKMLQMMKMLPMLKGLQL